MAATSVRLVDFYFPVVPDSIRTSLEQNTTVYLVLRYGIFLPLLLGPLLFVQEFSDNEEEEFW